MNAPGDADTRDAIAELVDLLAEGAVPSIAWLARNAPDGTLRAAWRTTHDANAMLQLLALAWGDELADDVLAEARRRATALGGTLDADGLRDVAAEPPTLAELWADGE